TRAGLGHLLLAPARNADHHHSDPAPRGGARHPHRDAGRLLPRQAFRSHGRRHLRRGDVSLVPRVHHRRPVPVRLPARLVPGAGLERQLLEEPLHLRAAAHPARGAGRPCAADAALPLVLPRRDEERLRAHGARQGTLGAGDPAQARAAQRARAGGHQHLAPHPRRVRRQLPAGDFLLHPGPGARDLSRGEPQRLPGDPGGDDLSRGPHHAHQPRGRRALQLRRPAHPAALMAAVLDVTPESAWTALWRRLQQDRVGAVSLGIVVAYLVMILFAMAGFLARGWSEEVGVPYANPGFLGERPNLEAALQKRMEHKGKAPDMRDVDPLAPKYDEWAKRTQELKSTEPERSLTLPWGGDRWGRDVLAKAIKGSQVSIAVGIVAALCATLI